MDAFATLKKRVLDDGLEKKYAGTNQERTITCRVTSRLLLDHFFAGRFSVKLLVVPEYRT